MKKYFTQMIVWLVLAVLVLAIVLFLNFQYFGQQILQAEKLTHTETTGVVALDLDFAELKTQIEAEGRLNKLEKFETWPVEINVENLGTQGNPFIVIE